MSFSALDSELLGPLFATEAMREVFSDRARLASMLRVEAALARASARHGFAPEALAAAIEAIDVASFDRAALGRQTAVAGVLVVPFLEALRALLPPDLARSVHAGATTQDIVDSALVVQMKAALVPIAADLDAVLRDLSALADRHRATPCIGRTYGQHAAPLTFGFKAAVWLAGVTEAASRLDLVRGQVLVASLGGPVGTLAAFGAKGPEVVAAFARELDLGVPVMSWHTSRARMTTVGAWLCELLGALAKMGLDVERLASTDIAELSEPDLPGRGGSSSMPHKRNPIAATVLLSAHAAARGHQGTLEGAMASAHERPAGAWHAEWHALPPLFGLVSGALREARSLAIGLVVHEERMRTNLAGAQERTGAADLGPTLEAAAVWIDRARAEAARVRESLRPEDHA